ncbi:MAG: XRE family transcriptional regulator [Campylobacterales bacterium]|nr:XRE family transcriptional regulator [Campylobacterales bacterium]
MNNEEFIIKLKEARLNKKEFVEITGLAYSTVANWSSTQNIPLWVTSWLENYIKAKDLDRVADAVAPILRNREG